ncbi:MAG: molybdopterin-dependent oxidoreductase [Treponema sp.]|nr:molybdopterin-dependent oxidoreductase [Treponema sp.]
MDYSYYFVEDFYTEGMLYALTLRSPVAKGRVKNIECPSLPPSYTLIQASDIPGKNQLVDFPIPILASETISYIGQPIALLVGPQEHILEDYASLCLIRVEEAKPAFAVHSFSPDMVLAKRAVSLLDTEMAFKEAKTVISGIYQTGIQEHWYSEPNGAAAVYSSNAISVYTATQWPFHVKHSLTSVLNLPDDAVTVIPAYLGIHLDGKLWYPSLIACQAGLASFITGKPVKLFLTREEDFRYSPKRNSSEIHIRSALGEKGKLLGTELNLALNLGSEGVFTDEILDRTCLGSLGVYNNAAFTLEGVAVKTNIPPQGAFSGLGLAQGFFAAERHISRIADALRQDPAEWRKAHFLKKGDKLSIGITIKENPPLEKLIELAAAACDYHRKWASYELLRISRQGNVFEEKLEKLRGIGIAAAYQGSGFLYPYSDKGVYSIGMTLEKDGSLEIETSMVSENREFLNIWRNIAAEMLTIDPAHVRLSLKNTGLSVDSGPASMSRHIGVISRLVERCCIAIRKQRFRDPLPIRVRRSCRPERGVSWDGRSMDMNSFSAMSWAAAVVEAEVDFATYTPNIRGVWLVVDGGRILSEKQARRTLTVSTIQALGWASWEKLYYEEGKIPVSLTKNYQIPLAREVPPIYIDFNKNDSAGPRGIGELPFNCIPAAYVQAVSQAMDHPFERIPLCSRDIWEVGKLKQEEGRINSRALV